MAKASDNVFPYVHVSPAAAPSSPAAGSQRLYLDSGDSNKLKRKDSSGTVVTIEGGSSGISSIPVAQTTYTSGNVTLSYSASKTAISGLDVTIAAATGDVVELYLGALISANSSGSSIVNCNFTAYTRVSSADVNNVAGGTANSSEWFAPDHTGGALASVQGTHLYTVQAGDISGGNVTFRLYYFLDNGGAATRTLFATSGNPALLRVKNLKH